jgi:hypothetical protein
MTWQEIRALCPHRWVIVEAIDAYNKYGKRIIPTMHLVNVFDDDPYEAWACYKRLHKLNAQAEYVVLHTDRLELDISVMDARMRKQSAQKAEP